MTYKEAIKKEKKWYRRALIISLFHHNMILKRKDWTVRNSAKRLGISIGMISESVRLAKAMDSELESMTRNDALRFLRYGYRKT